MIIIAPLRSPVMITHSRLRCVPTNFAPSTFLFRVRTYLRVYIQGVCRQSAKAKLRNRHFTGGFRGLKPFFLTLQTGLKFPVDKRSIKDVYYSQFQQQEKSAKLEILHF